MKSQPLTAVLCLSLLLISGCGESVKPGRGVPVSGTVTLGGKPLADADVMFTNDTFVGVAKTDAEGKYRLVQGALPGKNRVSVSRYEGGAAPPMASVQPAGEGMDAGQAAAAQMGWGSERKKAAGPKQLVPADYSDPTTTKLTYDVPTEGTDGVDFNL
ncbi:MAG: hypothetical protein RLZZ458_2180 [Planctomycetota bacterium]|jgi:hypothetical protein